MKSTTFTLLFCTVWMIGFSQITFKYGDNNNNYPSIIKSDGVHSYILGQTEVNGTTYGTITKINEANGSIVWQQRLGFASQINDMEFVPPQGPLGKTSLYLVGHTIPFDANNASFVAQINSETAALECSNIFDQTGRESFRKIIRNMNTPNPNFPYFILGTRGYSGGAVTQEKTILINLKNGCSGGTNVNFVKEYNFANSPDLEFSRGMAVLNDGSMLLMGNETANSYGMIVRINGAGNMQNAVVYTRDMEVTDATELSNGNILFSGKVNTNGVSSAILFVTDIKLNVLGRAAENKNILSYAALETDFAGGVYLPCFYKPMQNSNNTTFPLIQKLNIGGAVNSPLFTLSQQNSLENSNSTSSYNGVAMSIGGINSLSYTDGRNVNNTNLDFTFSKTDLSFSAPCADSVVTFLTPLELGFNNVEVTNVASTLPSPTTGNLVALDWAKSNFCAEPCKLDFTMDITERECNNVLCNLNITNGTLPYTISWDFECDGDVEANGLQGQYIFPSSGTFPVCIKVLDGMKCIKEKTLTITTNGDNQAPTLTCPANVTINCNDSTDPANTGLPTAIDNTDPNPVINPPSDIITQNTPCLKKIVRTWTAKDDCNNESTCTQVITIEDKIEPIITGCGRKIEVQGIKDANGKCKEKVTLLAPTVTDQCDANPTITNSYTNTNNATADYFEGTTIATWTATDQCGNTAVCRDTVIVLGCDSTCCINQQEFIDRVENAVTVAINNINVNPAVDCRTVMTISGLLECDKILSIEWGDGNITFNPNMNNESHQYIASGNYIITIKFAEKDGDKTCFNHIVTKEINIKCCDGCKYSNPKSFNNLKINYSNGWSFNLATVGTLPFPPSGITLNYSGNFNCVFNNTCFHDLYHSLLSNPNITISLGSSGPNFTQQLTGCNPMQLNVYSNWYIKSIGSCWTAPAAPGYFTQCQSSACFSFRNCDCDNNFKNDVDQGFLIYHNSNSCEKSFTPHRLSTCDRVTWKVNGVTVANNKAYDTKVGPFTLNNGINEVCMIVTRPSSTTTCIDSFCQQIFCFTSPSCPSVPNGGLSNGGNLGLLRDIGIDDWKSCGDNVFTQEDGYNDEGSLLLISGNSQLASITHDLKSNGKKIGSLKFLLKQYFTEKLDTNTLIVIRNQEELCGGKFIELGNKQLSKKIKGWEEIEINIDKNTELPYRFLSIVLVPKDTNDLCLYKIDNICFDLVSSIFESDLRNITIHPNPSTGQFDINLTKTEGRVKSIQIIDALGKVISNIPVNGISSIYSADLSQYGDGMYLVKVTGTDGALMVKKIIKID